MPGFSLSRQGARELAALQPPIDAAEFPRQQPGETITLLSSGRRLGYCEHVDPSTPPDQRRNVVLLPGIPGTRLFTHPAVQRLGFVPTWRLIVLERPGIGLSDPAPVPYTYTDFVADFREFCALLGLTRVSVIGFSAGTPFATAIACCARLQTPGGPSSTGTGTGTPGLGRPPSPPPPRPPPGPQPADAISVAPPGLSASEPGCDASPGSPTEPHEPQSQPASNLPMQPHTQPPLRPSPRSAQQPDHGSDEPAGQSAGGSGLQHDPAQDAPAPGSASSALPVEVRPGLRSPECDRDGLPERSRSSGKQLSAVSKRGSAEGMDAVAAEGAGGAATGAVVPGPPAAVPVEVAVEGVALVSAIGPPDTPNKWSGMALLFQLAYWACSKAPWLVGWLVRSEAAAVRRRPLDALRKGFAPYSGAADVATLRRPEVERMFLESAMEMYGRDQEDAVLRENLMFAGRPWGFDLRACATRVAIWQGGQDRGCTPAMAAHLAAMMGPQWATVNLLPGAGHMLYFDAWDEVVDWVNRIAVNDAR